MIWGLAKTGLAETPWGGLVHAYALGIPIGGRGAEIAADIGFYRSVISCRSTTNVRPTDQAVGGPGPLPLSLGSDSVRVREFSGQGDFLLRILGGKGYRATLIHIEYRDGHIGGSYVKSRVSGLYRHLVDVVSVLVSRVFVVGGDTK